MPWSLLGRFPSYWHEQNLGKACAKAYDVLNAVRCLFLQM